MVMPYGLSSLGNAGPHGYSEVLYNFTTAAANNGSAFAGLNANTPWYNLALAFTILLGRYPPIIFMMAVAGSIAAKQTIPATIGTLRTDTVKFGIFWLGVILLVGALTFFPALVLGPIARIRRDASIIRHSDVRAPNARRASTGLDADTHRRARPGHPRIGRHARSNRHYGAALLRRAFLDSLRQVRSTRCRSGTR